MKKIIITFIFFLFLIIGVRSFANDGWSSSQVISDGDIFSGEENKCIALNKEVIIYKPFFNFGSNVEITYEFENLCDNNIEIQACFPIIFKFNAKLYDKLKKTIYLDWDPNLENLYKAFFSKSLKNLDDDHKDTFDIVTIKDQKIFSFSDFEDISKSPVTGFLVNQNGEDIDIEKVLARYKLNDRRITFSFYFYHKLNFKSKQKSYVSINYWEDNHIGGSNVGHDSYNWNYSFTPAKTWNGNIKKIFVVTQSELCPKLPKKFNMYYQLLNSSLIFPFNINQTVYYANNFKPDEKSNIDLNYEFIRVPGGKGRKVFRTNGEFDYWQVFGNCNRNLKHYHKVGPDDSFFNNVIENKVIKLTDKTLKKRKETIRNDVLKDGKYWKISNRLLTSEELEHLNKDELRLLRNMFYAKNAKLFKTQDLQNYFMNFKWYRDMKYKHDYDYTTDVDKYNINKIIELENNLK
jgi:hypothetical protein